MPFANSDLLFEDLMPFANLLFEDLKLLADGPSLAWPEGIQIHSTNGTKRAIVAAVAQDRKASLQSKERARVAVEWTNQVITQACPTIIIFFSRGHNIITSTQSKGQIR
jgi:hypothetical protein